MNRTRPGNVHIIGGGTVFHVRPHLALSAPAYGKVARLIHDYALVYWSFVNLHLTKMADPVHSEIETNSDVSDLIDRLIDDLNTKVIFLPAALCDFTGGVIGYDESNLNNVTPSGKSEPRLKSDKSHDLHLSPSGKIISKIRKSRKDIFLVAFKTTSGASKRDQFLEGLSLLKKSSCNLVLANDIKTHVNMIITPEQSIYEFEDRGMAIHELVRIASARCDLTFTRSKVIDDGNVVPWNSEEIPDTLRKVIDWCISRGAYKPFNGSTVGHFAYKVSNNEFLTSIRKSNFNSIYSSGLVRIISNGPDEVIAHGSKPSVGGQSQRIIFSEHEGYNCIFHAHVPFREGHDQIPVAIQWPYECGSHECGKNTSNNLRDFDGIKAVMLEKHGPNVVFRKDDDPDRIIAFIEKNFDLSGSTDGFLGRFPIGTGKPINFMS